MALSHTARINKRESLTKAGHYEEDAIKLDVVNIVHQEENIYLDVFYHNSTNNSQRAYYSKTQNTAIVDRISDYKCYIASFQLRHSNFFMFVNRSFNLSLALYFQPDNLESIKFPLKTLYPAEYAFNSQFQVLNNPDGINDNIQQAFNDIVSQYEVIHGLGSWIANGNPLYPPFINYNTDNGFFEVYNDVSSSDNNANAVQLYLSSDLYILISGLPIDSPVINPYGTNSTTLIPPNYARVNFNIAPANNNVVTIDGNDYVKINQAYRSLSRWYTLKSVLLASDSIGVRSHYVAQSSQNSVTVYRNIISIVDIIFDDRDPNQSGGIITYIPSGEFNYNDLVGDGALKTLQFELLFFDVHGNISNVVLKPGDSFNFSLVMVKKI